MYIFFSENTYWLDIGFLRITSIVVLAGSNFPSFSPSILVFSSYTFLFLIICFPFTSTFFLLCIFSFYNYVLRIVVLSFSVSRYDGSVSVSDDNIVESNRFDIFPSVGARIDIEPIFFP